MRPQRIVSYLSLNVIIHLEVKLNYGKILENGWISKGKRAPVISLIAKSKESDTVFLAKICMWFTAFWSNIWVEITAFQTEILYNSTAHNRKYTFILEYSSRLIFCDLSWGQKINGDWYLCVNYSIYLFHIPSYLLLLRGQINPQGDRTIWEKRILKFKSTKFFGRWL